MTCTAGFEQARRTEQITDSHYSGLRSLAGDVGFLQMSVAVQRSIFAGSDAEVLRALSGVVQSEDGEEMIVVVDGWDELSRTTPTRLENRLRALEQTILDALPRENVGIIWVSEGVQHTANSIQYQRRCLHPLEHDSPRRQELDEVIWNLPVRPRVLDWQAPWSSERRVIVQDTPTDVPPWRCMISVPHIAEWAARFRGVASRRRTVPRSEAMTITATPMHGRLVTMTSLRSQPAYLSHHDSEQLMNDALDLVPSLLRARGAETEPEVASVQSEMVLVAQAVWTVDSRPSSTECISPWVDRRPSPVE